jgi:hypothetical protein
MTALSIEPLEVSDLKAVAKNEGGRPTLVLSGSADIEEPARLGAVLRQLHDEVVKASAAEVAVDFRNLEFMNSSCFKEFVSWLAGLEDLEPSKRYRIRFLSSPDMHWQRRSLNALACFAGDLVTIEA